MANIVFFGIPAHGHTNPTLNVVRELVARGHQVRYYSYNLLREKIEETGAVFISCDAYDMEQRLTQKQATRLGKDLTLSTRVLADTTLALENAIREDLNHLKPDCIVADSMAIWGKAIAKKMGIPFVSSTTTFAFNQHSAKIMKQSPLDLLRILFAMPGINRQLKRLQSHGYPFHSILDILQNDNDTHSIVYTSPEFQPCSDTFSDKYAFVGPSVRPAAVKIQKTHDKLIYISMGTVNNHMLPLYRRFVQAFARTDYQVILSVGNLVSMEQFDTLPENISVYPSVDQIAVLQQADLFFSHCGMNSVSESLFFGVPLVMLPQTPEQEGVARRVQQLHAGILLERTTSSAMLAAAEEVLSTPAYRDAAMEISRSFQTAPGPKGAADKILSLCSQNMKNG